jgi:hypothetical protein
MGGTMRHSWLGRAERGLDFLAGQHVANSYLHWVCALLADFLGNFIPNKAIIGSAGASGVLKEWLRAVALRAVGDAGNCCVFAERVYSGRRPFQERGNIVNK